MQQHYRAPSFYLDFAPTDFYPSHSTDPDGFPAKLLWGQHFVRLYQGNHELHLQNLLKYNIIFLIVKKTIYMLIKFIFICHYNFKFKKEHL